MNHEKQEVTILGETYPYSPYSGAPYTYKRASWESIEKGDRFQILRPIEVYVGNEVTKEIPTQVAIFTVVYKTHEPNRNDQCRYSIKMQAKDVDSEIATQSWTLMALNTDLSSKASNALKTENVSPVIRNSESLMPQADTRTSTGRNAVCVHGQQSNPTDLGTSENCRIRKFTK